MRSREPTEHYGWKCPRPRARGGNLPSPGQLPYCENDRRQLQFRLRHWACSLARERGATKSSSASAQPVELELWCWCNRPSCTGSPGMYRTSTRLDLQLQFVVQRPPFVSGHGWGQRGRTYLDRRRELRTIG